MVIIIYFYYIIFINDGVMRYKIINPSTTI